VSSEKEPAALAALESDYEIVRELGRGGTAIVYLALVRALFAAAWSDLVLLATNLVPPRFHKRHRAPESVSPLSSTTT